MNLDETLKTVLEKIQNQAGANIVFGQPVEKGNKVIIPVAKTMYGFGGGKCQGMKSEGKDEDKGNGLGGGVVSKPIGIVEITDEKTTFIPINDLNKSIGLVLLGVVIGSLFFRRKTKVKHKKNA